MDKISSKTLRFVPVILLIIYFGAIDRIDLFNEEIRLYILFAFGGISLVAAGVLFARRELETSKVGYMVVAIFVSFLIFTFSA